MTSNPFLQTGVVNSFDMPLTAEEREQRAKAGGAGAARGGLVGIGNGEGVKGADIVTYDSAAQAINAPGAGMLQFILAKVAEREGQFSETVVELMAETVAPLTARIAHLESALGAAQAEVAEALGKSLDDFANPEPGQSLDELNAMAKRHKKDMESRK